MKLRSLSVAVIILLSSVRLFAQYERSEYEAVLFPIAAGGIPGENGTRWGTRAYVMNDSDRVIEHLGGACHVTCPDFPHLGVIEPGRVDSAAVQSLASPPYARLWHVRRNDLRHLQFSVRVIEDETYRNGKSFGTEVPVVRESQMFTGRAHLMSIPTVGETRWTLRAYSPHPCVATSLRVQFFPSDELLQISDEPLFETTLSLYDSYQGFRCSFPEVPSFAEFSWRPGMTIFGDHQGLRAVVEPITPGSKYWAAVSVTSNATSAVTFITAQGGPTP